MRGRGRATGEAGETLIELLATMVILGIAVVAILGGVFTTITISDYHRRETTAVTMLRSFAETMKAPGGKTNGNWNYVVQGDGSQYLPTYLPCSSSDPSPTYPTYSTGDSRYVASMTVEYLQANPATTATPSFGPTCPTVSGTPTDYGLQQLTLTITDQNGTRRPVRESMVIVKRNACDDAEVTCP